MAMVEQLERELQGAFLRNQLFSEAELLGLRLRGGGAACREETRAFLARVQEQIEKHKQELRETESSGVVRGFLRVRSWVLSHPRASALLAVCVLISVVLLVTFGGNRH
ncbi:GTPase IMAP family member 5 [Galemys pyrenaicus]|uniref:GTPase IMAP family member 5 n=1 Tax=Galemys pyrenaicus TaxID=202257 RepID=A0A8J6A6N0_GALPY|nr:GTPase IMAP family member 5 [Galemys pyrenaicus]